ncbi:MAG: sodium:solute symporter family protein [Clostridiales Family XIII bacterium]|jgi:Na+/proline symporter|nr:sodium:solute symporter family protein [Clostridiales Family XIII bacterium]
MSVISLSGIFLIVLTVVFVIMGIRFRKYTSTSEDFMLGGRKAPFWLMFAAYLGGAIGGSSVSGWLGYGYTAGMSSIWVGILPSLGLTVFILFFARRLNHFGRITGAVTITDFLCARYGESVRVPAAIMSFFRPAFITGMQYLAIAVVLNVAFGWPMELGVVLSAVVILAYLVTAGQYSAIVTQWIQAILQSLSIILVCFVAIKLAGGTSAGVEAFYTMLPENFVNGFQITWSQFSVWFLTLCLFYAVDPWAYMWAYIGKTPRVAQNAQVALGATYYGFLVFLGGMFVAVAVASGNLFIPENITPDGVFSYIALEHSGIGIGTFLIVGLLMTIISCGSSFVMNGVTILTKDIYGQVINKNASDKQTLRASRISVVLVSLFGVAGALWLPILVPLWVLAQALALSGLLAAVISAWFWKRATTAGAMASIILGGVSGIGWAMYAWITTGSPGNLIGGFHAAHIGLIVSIPAMIIVSLATKPNYEKVDATSYRALGTSLKAAMIKAGTPEKPGFYGFFGAETSTTKFAWMLVIVLFVLHYFLVFVFQMNIFGVFTVWLSLINSVVITIIVAVMGGLDLRIFFGSSKAPERLKA